MVKMTMEFELGLSLPSQNRMILTSASTREMPPKSPSSSSAAVVDADDIGNLNSSEQVLTVLHTVPSFEPHLDLQKQSQCRIMLCCCSCFSCSKNHSGGSTHHLATNVVVGTERLVMANSEHSEREFGAHPVELYSEYLAQVYNEYLI